MGVNGNSQYNKLNTKESVKNISNLLASSGITPKFVNITEACRKIDVESFLREKFEKYLTIIR